TLSHHVARPGPPLIVFMSVRRNDNSTAFFSHWLTCQLPSAPGSATRTAPLSSSVSARSTALRTGPLVLGVKLSRRSKASSMVCCNPARSRSLRLAFLTLAFLAFLALLVGMAAPAREGYEDGRNRWRK